MSNTEPHKVEHIVYDGIESAPGLKVWKQCKRIKNYSLDLLESYCGMETLRRGWI